MSDGKRLLRWTGNSASLVYLIFSLAAYVAFPKSFSPLNHWLSDLGNPLMNRRGALFYDAGVGLTACLLAVWFVGLRRIKTEKRKARIFLTIAWITGLCASLTLLTSALFPLGPYTKIHSTACSVMFVALTYFQAFSATVILMQSGFNKCVGVFGAATALGTFIFGVWVNVFIGEWIAVAAFIIYVLLLSNCSGIPFEVPGKSPQTLAG